MSKLAEREGFEPSIRFKTYTPLAGERLQPLGHLSVPAARLSVISTQKTRVQKLPVVTGRFFRLLQVGAPGRIRTSDRLVRSQVLYPAELRARRFATSELWS